VHEAYPSDAGPRAAALPTVAAQPELATATNRSAQIRIDRFRVAEQIALAEVDAETTRRPLRR
jgi:hypothetical protein